MLFRITGSSSLSIYLQVHISPRERYCSIALFWNFGLRNSSSEAVNLMFNEQCSPPPLKPVKGFVLLGSSLASEINIEVTFALLSSSAINLMDWRFLWANRSFLSSSFIFSWSFLCSSAWSFSSCFLFRRTSRSFCFCSLLRNFSSLFLSLSYSSSSFCFLKRDKYFCLI